MDESDEVFLDRMAQHINITLGSYRPGSDFDRLVRLARSSLARLDAGAATQAGQVRGIDAQVLLAGALMDDAQRKQPEWLFFSMDDGRSLGRWAKHPLQAPYIRADLVLASLNQDTTHDETESGR